MKITKISRRRVHSTRFVDTESSSLGNSTRSTGLSVPKGKKGRTEGTARQTSAFRTNIGRLVSSERDETTTAIAATRRDRMLIAKKYETV